MEQQDWILDRGRAWRDQARALRLQIQDRFRVAVDRHRYRRSHHAPTLERWILRARCFLRDPSGSRIDSISSRFYKKPGEALIRVFLEIFEHYFFPLRHEGRLWIHAAGKVPDPATIKAMEDFYRVIYAVNGITDIKFPEQYPVSRLIG